MLNSLAKGPTLLDSIRVLRNEIKQDDGLAVPKIHVIDNLALPENSYKVYVQGTKAGSGVVADSRDSAEVLSSLRDAILTNRGKFCENL